MLRIGTWSPTLCLFLALVGCSDEISLNPEPNPPQPIDPGTEEPGPEEPGPTSPEDCHTNAHWDETSDTCVCDEGFESTSTGCQEVVPKKDCLLISSTDWSTSGSLSVFDVEANELLEDVTTYHQDSVVRVIDGEVFIVQRMYGDAILKLDASNNYAADWEESIRIQNLNAPNPTDLVRWGDYLYMPLYNDGRIVQANVNPLLSGSFLTGLEARISPPSWDGSLSELNSLMVVGDTIFGLTEGLGNDWSCGSLANGSPNRARIYAFDAATLQPKSVFENGQTYKELSFCNALGWVPFEGSKVLINSLGNYRSINGADNDGGLEIVDLGNPAAAAVIVAEEEDFGPIDILGAYVVGGDVYIQTIDEFYMPVYLHKLDTSNPTAWTLAGDSMLEGFLGSMVSIGDELFVVNRDYSAAEVVRINRHTGEPSGDSILTAIAPETLTLFQREGSCW